MSDLLRPVTGAPTPPKYDTELAALALERLGSLEMLAVQYERASPDQVALLADPVRKALMRLLTRDGQS